MTAKFYMETGDDPEEPVRIPDHLKSITIGRGPDNFLTIKDDKASLHHVTISRRLKKYVLEDQNSRNGTFVNDAAVTRVTLQSNDRIRIGGTVIRFAVDSFDAYHHRPVKAFETLPEERVSILCTISVILGVMGLFWWPLAVVALVFGALTAVNVHLRPKLQGMWLGVIGASLGGIRLLILLLGVLFATGAALSDATAKMECHKRLRTLSKSLQQYRDGNDGKGPGTLKQLHDEAYLKDVNALYCPAIEKIEGRHSHLAEYIYEPENVAENRPMQWIVRDRHLEAHGDGGHVLYSSGQAKWLSTREFLETTGGISP